MSEENIRPREEELKKAWAGKADNVTVNNSQYSLDSPNREKQFIEAQFITPEEKEHYARYRKEWYRRAKEFDPGTAPLAICCELVSTCNLGCSMCYTITEEFQASVVGAQRMLPWPIAKAVINETAKLDVPSILFSWRGESSLYKSKDENGDWVTFTDVLQYARDKGILEITCLTNGQLFDEETARKIVDAEPSWLSFSIDGMEDAYNKIRTPPNKRKTNYNAFQTVSESIKRIVRIRDEKGKTRPQVRTNTIFPAIANNPQEYHDYMESLGVGWVTVNELLDFRGDDLPEEAIIDDWACQYPFQRLTVSANGIILPCTGAHNEESGLVLGRYKGSAPKQIRSTDGAVSTIEVPETTLLEAWTSDKLEHIRQLHRENRRTEIAPGCKNCRHGAVKHGVRWIPGEWNMETMEWEGGVWRE